MGTCGRIFSNRKRLRVNSWLQGTETIEASHLWLIMLDILTGFCAERPSLPRWLTDQSMFKWGHVSVSFLRSHPGLETTITHHLLTSLEHRDLSDVSKLCSSCAPLPVEMLLLPWIFHAEHSLALVWFIVALNAFRSDAKPIKLFAGTQLHWTVAGRWNCKFPQVCLLTNRLQENVAAQASPEYDTSQPTALVSGSVQICNHKS